MPHRSPPSPKHTDTFLWVAGYPAGVKRLPRHMGDIRDCLFGLIVLEFWVSHDFPHRHQIIRGEIAGQALHRQPSEIHVSTIALPWRTRPCLQHEMKHFKHIPEKKVACTGERHAVHAQASCCHHHYADNQVSSSRPSVHSGSQEFCVFPGLRILLEC